MTGRNLERELKRRRALAYLGHRWVLDPMYSPRNKTRTAAPPGILRVAAVDLRAEATKQRSRIVREEQAVVLAMLNGGMES